MRAPSLHAKMERRILVNYRVDPDFLAGLLPAPFCPALVHGHGIAGICLIRLGAIRPAGVPGPLGLTTENVAHRVAVQWVSPDGPVTGVYVHRRDTSSRLAALVGGRMFPGWQHHAHFDVAERDGRYHIQVESDDRAVRVVVAAHVADTLMPGSVFVDLDEVSRFFCDAPLGYAATPTEGVFDGVALTTGGWDFRPLHLDEVSSTFFDDPGRFPSGAVTVDSAFVMGGLSTTWQPQPNLVAAALTGPSSRRSRRPSI